MSIFSHRDSFWSQKLKYYGQPLREVRAPIGKPERTTTRHTAYISVLYLLK